MGRKDKIVPFILPRYYVRVVLKPLETKQILISFINTRQRNDDTIYYKDHPIY